MVTSSQSAFGSNAHVTSGACTPTLLLWSTRVSGCTRFGRSGTDAVASAVARRSARSTATNPPSTTASFPTRT